MIFQKQRVVFLPLKAEKKRQGREDSALKEEKRRGKGQVPDQGKDRESADPFPVAVRTVVGSKRKEWEKRRPEGADSPKSQ